MATPTKAYTDHEFDVAHPGVSVEDFQTSENDWADGVHTIYGIREEEGPNGGKTVVSGFRFDAGEYTVDEAREWLDDQGFEGAEIVREGSELGRGNPPVIGSYTYSMIAGIGGFLAGLMVSGE